MPLLSWVSGGSPWAESPRESASHLLECALGRYSSDVLMEWQLPVGFDAVASSGRVAAEPDVWTDGSLVEDKVSGASFVGAGCSTCRCSRLWADRMWGHLDEDVGEDAFVSACRGFCSVPGPLQSVQRAEFWGVTIPPEINSHDFGGFLELISRFEFDFVVAKIIFFEGFEFLVRSCECAVAC